jgi:hypothetical protein
MLKPNLEMLARTSHAVINRLNYPKREARAMTRRSALRAKSRTLIPHPLIANGNLASKRPLPHGFGVLSRDGEEIYQTCAMVLTASGAIYRDKLTLADWLAMFRACRALLRIDRKAHEDATNIATLETFPLVVSEPARFTARRSAIARHIRYDRACIAIAFHLDKSRQRRHNRDKAIRFLRFLASQASATGLGHETVTGAHDLAGLRMTAMSFRRYVATGETVLEREALADVTARNADRRPKTLKSFHQFAIAA